MANEISADVVVVGFGGSGAAAAIEAHDAGASVIVLEKMEDGGGSTRESSGSLRVIKDPEKAERHFCALTSGATPTALMRVFAEGAMHLPDWIEQHGGVIQRDYVGLGQTIFPHGAPTTSFPNFPDSEGVGGRTRVQSMAGEGPGAALWNVLSNSVQSRNIRVLYETRGQRLIKENGEITGVRALAQGRDLVVDAKRAVVLTCGGFNYNHQMQRQFVGVELPAMSPPGRSTGDGIKMAQDVGADLWHMNSVAAGFGIRAPEHEAAFFVQIMAKGFFIVDQKSRRYVNEPGVESHSGLLLMQVIDPIDGCYYRIPSYLIFDERTRKSTPIVTQIKHSHNQRFPWSKDNSEEIEKGWIQRANTLAELANKLGIPAGRLEETAQRYNSACDLGDDEFQRQRDQMEKVDQAPYYGVALWPALLNTQGGPRRNERAQVIDVFGEPIPRLYSAGELGSIWGPLYPGAGNVCEALVFGKVAGINAAGERQRH